MLHVNRKEVKIFLTLMVVYATFITFLDWSDKSLLDSALVLVYQPGLQIDPLLGSSRFNTGDRIYYEGQFYSNKAPGLSFISYPLVKTFSLFFGFPEGNTYWWLILLMTSLTSSLFTSLTCILIYRISKYFTEKENLRIITALLYGFGSQAFSYATTIKVYASATFFAFLCFYLVFIALRKKASRQEYFILAGFAAGVAGLVEYPAALVGVYCFILIMISKRRSYAFYYLFGLLPVCLSFLAFNFLVFNTPLYVSYFHSDVHVFSQGKSPVNSILQGEFVLRGSTFTDKALYIIERCAMIFFSPYAGLVIYTPFILLSFLGFIVMFRKHRTEAVFVVFVVLSFLLFYSLRGSWWGNTGLGNRYLLMVIPFLVLPFLCIADRINYKLLIALLVLSFAINLVGTQRIQGIAYSYGAPQNNFIMSIDCFLKAFEHPLEHYYIPLFLNYGPQSFVLGNLLGFDLSNWLGINLQIPPFLNLAIVSMIILLIWYREAWQFFVVHRKAGIVICCSIIFFFVLRGIFAAQIAEYQKDQLHNFYEDKKCPDNFVSTALKPFYAGFVEDRTNRFKTRFGWIPLIPYSLWVDDNLPVTVGTNTGWKRPDILLTKIHWSYENATINLYNNLSNALPVTLNFGVAASSKAQGPKRFRVYLNDRQVRVLSALPDNFSTYAVDLNLEPGWNSIRFRGREGCDQILLCADLRFRKIQIFNRNKNDLFYYGKNWIEDEHRYLERPKILMSDHGKILMNSTRAFAANLTFKLYSNEVNRTLNVYHNRKQVGTYHVTNDFYYQNTIVIPLNISVGMNVVKFITAEGCSNYTTPENRTYCVSFIATIDYNRVVSFY